MAAETGVEADAGVALKLRDWVKTALIAALVSAAAVLLFQLMVLTVRPDLVRFQPLSSYTRTAALTVIHAMVGTAVFAWLARHAGNPVIKFLGIAVLVLLLSFIPLRALPLPGNTLFGCTLVTALLHAVAGTIMVTAIVLSYRSQPRAADGARPDEL